MALKEIFVVRHAESDEDINSNLKCDVTDAEISITRQGRGQVLELKQELQKDLMLFKGLRVVVSPANRAAETAKLLTQGLVDQGGSYYSFAEPIRNLNWGNVSKDNIGDITKERYKAGVLYYSFPGGDHTPDYVKNIQFLTDTFLKEGLQPGHPEALLVVAHGFSMRLIIKCLTNMRDKEFKWLANPHNCFIANLSVVGRDIKLKTEMPVYKPK